MGEVVKGRQQFASGQVARGAEDDERGGRDWQSLETGGKGVLGSHLSGWMTGRDRHRQPPLRGPATLAGLPWAFAPPAFPTGPSSVAWSSPGALFTAWPPNWLRSAASTRSAKSPLPRERSRAYSEAVITGVGTSCAVASAIVQRPSPESSV